MASSISLRLLPALLLLFDGRLRCEAYHPAAVARDAHHCRRHQLAVAVAIPSAAEAPEEQQPAVKSRRSRVAPLKFRKQRGKNWRVVGLHREAQQKIARRHYDEARELLLEGLRLDDRDAHTWLSLARLDARTKDVAEARDAFQRASDACPDNVRIIHANAVFEQKAGATHLARSLFQRAAALEPANAYVSHAWGLLEESVGNTYGSLQRRSGDVNGAVSSFEEALALEPRAPTYVEYALLESGRGDVDKARRLFESGLNVDPSHGPLHSAMAKFEARNGKVTSARQRLAEAVEAHPCATLYHSYGKLEERQGNLIEAAHLYERGARLGRKKREDASYLWHSLGAVLLQQRQLDKALDAFNEGLSRAPASSQLLLGAASVHALRGNSELARQQFLRSVQADASHAHAWHAWGVMEARLGNSKVAEDLYRRGLEKQPHFGPLWQASAKLQYEQSEHDKARRTFQEGLSRCPRHAPLYVSWAYYELHQGKHARCLELLTSAREIAPSSGELYYVEALMYLKLGRPRQARNAVEEGLERAPTHAPLYRILGGMQDLAGEVEAARASFEEGLRLNPGYAQLYHAAARLEGRLLNWGALNELNKKARDAFPQMEQMEPQLTTEQQLVSRE